MTDRTEAYAGAIVEIARAEDSLDTVADEIYQLARAMDRSDDLRLTLADRSLPAARRLVVVDDLLEHRALPLTTNIVAMLVGAGRGGDIPAIADRVVALAAESRGKAVAEVRSAVPLSPDQLTRLEQALSANVGRQVEVKVIIDPEILGGLVAQIDDTIIDGSIRTRIEKLKEQV